MRLLLVTESHLGSGILGHHRMEQVLRDAQDGGAALELDVLRVPNPSGWRGQLIRGVPGLRRFDLDGQQRRWHAIQSSMTRRSLRGHLKRNETYDAIVVHTQSVAFGLSRWRPLDVRVLISTDVGTRAWRSFALWRPSSLGTNWTMRLSERAERRAFDSADAILAWSAWSAATLPSTGTPTEVWHPGVERQWHAHVRAPVPESPPLVLFVGGRFEAKGGRKFLEGVRPLVEQGTAEAHIVTQDEVLPEAGISVSHDMPGSAEILHLFDRASVLVLPSLGDAVPWVVIEAMCRGCAIVASPVGATGELVGGAGLIVDMTSATVVTKSLLALLGDADRLLLYRKKALERAADFQGIRNTEMLLELIAGLPVRHSHRGRR